MEHFYIVELEPWNTALLVQPRILEQSHQNISCLEQNDKLFWELQNMSPLEHFYKLVLGLVLEQFDIAGLEHQDRPQMEHTHSAG